MDDFRLVPVVLFIVYLLASYTPAFASTLKSATDPGVQYNPPCIPLSEQNKEKAENDYTPMCDPGWEPPPPPPGPATPAQPSASISGTSINVSWGAVSGATSYRVQQRVNSGNWQTEINKGTTRSHAFSGAAGNSYHYRVRACNVSACSAYSTIRTVSFPSVPVIPPTPSASQQSSNSISVSWGSSGGGGTPLPCQITGTCHCQDGQPCIPLGEPTPEVMALKADDDVLTAQSTTVSYRVQQRLGSGAWQTEINKSTATSHTYTGLAAGSYTYRARACNSSGCSNWSGISAATTIVVPPGIPTGLAASQSSLTINTSWNAVTGATSYRIRQSINGNWQTELSKGTSRTHAFSVTSGNSYQYQVRACNTGGCSGWSAATAAITPPAIPAVPAGLSANLSGLTINTGWNASTNATSYRIRQSVNGSWQGEINKGTARTHAFTVTPGSSYQYQVKACGASGCSGWSAATTSIAPPPVPGVPPSPVASIQTGNSIVVSWAGSGGGGEPLPCQITGTCHCDDYSPCIPLDTPSPVESMQLKDDGLVTIQSSTFSYYVQQRLGSGSWQASVNKGAATSHNYAGLSPGSYTYRVQACSSSGCSAWSGISAATTIVAPPAVPAGLSATQNLLTINTNWNAVAGATSYRIRQSANGSWQAEINKNAALSHTYSVSAAVSYQYQVKACNAGGCSAWSAATPAIMPLSIPLTPAGLSAGLSGLTINTNWNAATNATSYLIRQSVNGSWQAEINKGTARTHAFTVAPGSSYQYQVKACGTSGCSGWSAATSSVTPPPLPAVPPVPSAGLVASANSITVSWYSNTSPGPDPEPCQITGTCHCNDYGPCQPLGNPEPLLVQEEKGSLTTQTSTVTYQLQGYRNGAVWGSEIVNIGGSSRSVSWSLPGAYTFKVRACNNSGCSAYTALSNAVTVSQVGTPAATPNGGAHSGQVNVTLSTATAGAVIRYTLNNTAVTSSSAQYSAAMTLNQSATLRAKAFKAGMADSIEINKDFTVVPLAPSKPSASVSGTMVNVIWEDVSGASGYQIQYKSATTNWGAFVTSNNGSGHSYPSLALGQYQFRVRACNPLPDNCSAVSAASAVIDTSRTPVATPDSVPQAHSQSIVVDTAVVGGTSGAFRVDESGAATYNIPLQLPAGIAGNTPELSLNYHSSAGNGPLGIGWSIGGLSSIERCRQTPVQDGTFKAITLTNADRFCLDGQRLMVVSGSYGAAGSVYATEIDSQVKVTALGNLYGGPEYFEVRRPDGSISYYGNTEDSRFSAASGPAISWAISEVTDLIGAQGNKIYYNYAAEGNEQLISSVTYSGNEIRFHYYNSARTDRPKVHIFGVNVMPSSLLERISVTNHTNALIHELRMEHDTAPLSGVARMLKITECGVGGSCLKPLLLEWNEAAESSPGFKTNVAISHTLGTNTIVFSQSADINGDGLTDWVYVTKGSHNIYQVYYLQGTGAGFRAAESMSSGFSSTTAPEFRLANIYGDGSTSLLYYTDKWFICAQGAITCFATDITEKDIALHDITGNGQADVISKTYYKLNESRNVFCLSPGCNSFHTEFSPNTPLSLVNQEGGPVKCSGQTGSNIICSTELTSLQQLSAFDINGDGLNDFVAEVREKCNPQTEDCRGYRAARYWGIFLAEQLAGNSVRFRLSGTLGGVTTDTNTAANLQLADLNGDGLADLLYFEAGRWHIRFYNQKAEIIESVTLPSSVPNADNAKFIQAVDVTGNGINELVYYHSGWRMLRHPYSGAPVTMVGPGINVSAESAIFSDLRGQGKPGIAVTDFSNKRLKWFNFGAQAPEADPCLPDCLPPCLPGQDCQIIRGVPAQPYSMSAANQVPVQHQGVTNRTQDTVRRFIDGHGLSTAVNYSFLTNSQVYKRGFGLNLASSTDLARVFNIGGSIPVVSAVQSDTAQGAVGVTYKYEGARLQAGGRGFLGYEKLTSVDSQTGIVSTTRYLQHFPFIGMPSYTKQEYNGKTISFSRNMYGQIELNNGKTVYPYLKRSFEEKYAVNYLSGTYGNPTFVSSVATENNYSIVSDRYVALGATTMATYDKDAGIVRTVQTVNDYNHDDLSRWLINRVSRSDVTHQQGSGTLSAYDNCVICTEPSNSFTITNSMNADPAATVARTAAFDYYPSGLLKDEITEPDGDAQSYLKTSYTYDAVGNLETTVVSSKAGAGDLFRINRHSENIYDSAGRYITSKKVNGKTVASYSSFNALGQAQTVTENGIRSVLRFNAFGQPVFSREQTPGGAVSGRFSIITRGYTTTAVGLPSVGVSGYSYERVQQGGAPTQWKVADAAGRELATIVEAFDSEQYVVRQTQYDTMGRPVAVSQPAFDTGSATWNQSDYDIFGRPVLLLAADGTRTDISYSGLSVTSKVSGFRAGAAAQSKTETKDAFGQLRSVTDAAGTMTYQYDATGNLLSVTGVDGEVMVMTYNSRGHKQTMVDPDSGSWSYKYNALGELVKQTNPKSHITQTWYDDFGRKVTEDIQHGEAVLRSTQWGYSDEAGHTVRNLVVSEVVDNGAARIFDYDTLGRLERSELHIEGELLIERTTYDEFSRVFQVFDAGGNSFGTQYEYQNGYSKAVWEARYGIDNAYSVRYQNIIAMDAFGNVTESKAGNNRITWREHDDTTGMLKAITTQGGLQAWDYEFDGIGNLLSRIDQTHKLPSLSGGSPVAFNESFEYDNLNRLEKVFNNGIQTQSLSYFANGSIKTKSDVHSGATYQYGTKPGQCSRNSGPRAVSQIGNTSYCYDAGGQQTQQYNNGTLVRQIDYDAIGKPSRIRSIGTDATTNSSLGDSFFTYDGSRNIVKRHVTEQGSTKTIYQHGGVELIRQDGSTTIRRNIGNAIVEVSGNTATTRYVYSDHLGSVDVITNAAGLIEQKLSFDAFGKRRQVFSQSNQPVALTLAAILNLTHRGFTGHLQVDHANVIHMGGRIYDAHIGRFLQADPFVQAPSNSQSHNRYSYVLNNPLSYTDPSGYFFKALKKYWKVIVAAVASYYTFGIASAWASGWVGGVIGGAAAGFVGGAIASGSLKGALQGAFSGALFGGIGGALGNAHTAAQVGAHALAGGVISTMQGGKFGHGFFSAGFTKWAGKAWSLETSKDVIGNSLKQAIIGGTASKITGNKFANGAFTAALQYIVNEASKLSFTSGKSPQQYLDENLESGEITAGLRIKRSGLTYDTSSGRLGVDTGLTSFDGESLGYNASAGALTGGITQNLITGEMEASLSVGRTFRGVAGVDAGGFVNSNGNVGVQASATMRYYTAFVRYTMPITMPVRNAYHSFIATTEALYNDANRGVGK